MNNKNIFLLVLSTSFILSACGHSITVGNEVSAEHSSVLQSAAIESILTTDLNTLWSQNFNHHQNDLLLQVSQAISVLAKKNSLTNNSLANEELDKLSFYLRIFSSFGPDNSWSDQTAPALNKALLALQNMPGFYHVSPITARLHENYVVALYRLYFLEPMQLLTIDHIKPLTKLINLYATSKLVQENGNNDDKAVHYALWEILRASAILPYEATRKNKADHLAIFVNNKSLIQALLAFIGSKNADINGDEWPRKHAVWALAQYYNVYYKQYLNTYYEKSEAEQKQLDDEEITLIQQQLMTDLDNATWQALADSMPNTGKESTESFEQNSNALKTLFSIPYVMDYTYNSLKQQQLQLGLDLQGGMQVTIGLDAVSFLKNLIKRTTDATFLNRLEKGDTEKVMELADSTYVAAIADNNKVLEVLMLNILSKGAAKKADFNGSNNFFSKVYNTITNFNESRLKDSLLIQNLNEHGRSYLEMGNYSNGIKKIHESLVISKKNKDSLFIGDSYKWLGNAYAMQALYNDAIFYYTESVRYDKSIKMKYLINSNLGNIYTRTKEYSKAEKYLLETLKATDNNNFDLLVSNESLATLYTKMKKYKKAHFFYLKAEEYALRSNNKLYQLENKTSLITSYTNIKDYASAKRYAKICDSLASGINSNSRKMGLYDVIYVSAAKMKDYEKAFDYSKKYMSIKDSMFSIEKTKIVKDLKIKHESDLKESEILSQKELIKTKETQNTGLLVSLGLILISMLFMFLSYRKRLSAQKKLLKKQEELSFEKMNTILERQKVKTYESHIEGQNKERERIAKDLHDSVSGNLAAIKLKLTNLKNSRSEEIAAVISNLDATYNEVRTISHNLLPQKIIKQNFTKNIEQLVLLYSSNNLKIELEIFPEEEINKLPQIMEVELNRILQELITNIVKHAKATKCTISLILHEEHLNVIVEDNGLGFDITKKSKGIGLSNILSRIQTINGSIDIDSLKSKGTTVNINIPTI